MTDRQYIRLNTSIATGSNASDLISDENGNIEAKIDLRLPDNFVGQSASSGVKGVEMSTTKMRVSMMNTPIAAFGGHADNIFHNLALNGKTNARIAIWPYLIRDDGVIYKSYYNRSTNTFLEIPNNLETVDKNEYLTSGKIYVYKPSTLEETLAQALTYCLFTSTSPRPQPDLTGTLASEYDWKTGVDYVKVHLAENSFSIQLSTYCGSYYHPPVLYGTPGAYDLQSSWRYNETSPHDTYHRQTFIAYQGRKYRRWEFPAELEYRYPDWSQAELDETTKFDYPVENGELQLQQTPGEEIGASPFPYISSGNEGDGDLPSTLKSSLSIACMVNIVGNKALHDAFPFLPWIKLAKNNSFFDGEDLYVEQQSPGSGVKRPYRIARYKVPDPTAPSEYPTKYIWAYYDDISGEDDYYYVLDAAGIRFERSGIKTSTISYCEEEWEDTLTEDDPRHWVQMTTAGYDLTYTWPNLPTVLISPIQSIVLLMEGVNVNQQVQPINIALPGGSSLTSAIPVIENYYSGATTIRDLHDELVVSKDAFANTPTFTVDPSISTERTIRFRLCYITKDGRLHHLYIPPTGIFTLQVTFCLYY